MVAKRPRGITTICLESVNARRYARHRFSSPDFEKMDCLEQPTGDTANAITHRHTERPAV